MNRVFVLLFQNGALTAIHTRYFLSTIEIKDFMINDRNAFDEAIKNDLKKHNIQRDCHCLRR